MDPVATVGTFLLAGVTLFAALVVLELVMCLFTSLPYLFHLLGVVNHGWMVLDDDDDDDDDEDILPTVMFPAAAVRSAAAGLSHEEVDALPTFRYFDGGTGVAVDCAVCLAQLRDNEWVRGLPRCKHCFHAECVDPWLGRSGTCPLCRSSVKPKPKVIELAPVLVLQWGHPSASPPLSHPTPSPSLRREDQFGRSEAMLEWVKRRILTLKWALGFGSTRPGDQGPADAGRREEELWASV